MLAATDISTRDRRLATLAEVMTIDAVPIDQPIAEMWARLRLLLRDAGRRMPVNESWIAATAMTLGVPVVTQDDHYAEVVGLVVIRV